MPWTCQLLFDWQGLLGHQDGLGPSPSNEPIEKVDSSSGFAPSPLGTSRFWRIWCTSRRVMPRILRYLRILQQGV